MMETRRHNFGDLVGSQVAIGDRRGCASARIAPGPVSAGDFGIVTQMRYGFVHAEPEAQDFDADFVWVMFPRCSGWMQISHIERAT